VSRTKTIGTPAQVLSPWIEWKISFTRSVGSVVTGRLVMWSARDAALGFLRRGTPHWTFCGAGRRT
jgi:hypothetical protein